MPKDRVNTLLIGLAVAFLVMSAVIGAIVANDIISTTLDALYGRLNIRGELMRAEITPALEITALVMGSLLVSAGMLLAFVFGSQRIEH